MAQMAHPQGLLG